MLDHIFRFFLRAFITISQLKLTYLTLLIQVQFLKHKTTHKKMKALVMLVCLKLVLLAGRERTAQARYHNHDFSVDNCRATPCRMCGQTLMMALNQTCRGCFSGLVAHHHTDLKSEALAMATSVLPSIHFRPLERFSECSLPSQFPLNIIRQLFY